MHDRPLRIGFDVSPLTPARTGVGNYTYALFKHLLRADSDLSFHAFSTGMHGVSLAGLPEPTSQQHWPIPTRAAYALWNTLGRPHVDKALGGVDIYHATNYVLPPLKKARSVVTFYDLSFLRNPAWCSPKIVGPFSKGVRRFAQEADAILTCSQATREDVIALLGTPAEKVHVAYGAVEESFLPLPQEEAIRLLREDYGLSAPFLLFVGTIEPRKNVEGLLHAFAAIQNKLPHQLVLLGKLGWKSDHIPDLIASLGLEDRVIQLGYIKDFKTLPAFYQGADAFLFPSFYEGFGLPVLEAMQCGCPVLCSDQAALPEVAGDAALYCQPEDIDAIAQGIETIALSPEKQAALRAKGFEQAQAFSWNACAQATLKVYRQLGSE